MRRTLAVLSCLFASWAVAQPYPSKPVKLVVPWPAGGLVDIVARTYGERLQADLGQPVIVDNKPGAGGMIGAELGAKAEPDGHTLVLTTTALTMNAALGQKGAEDTALALVPVRNGAWAPSILVTRPGFPARTLKELVELAKAQPGKFTYASVGNGSPTHFASEMFKAAAGVDLVHVPYKGTAQLLPDLISGRIPMAIDSLPAHLPHLRAGKTRALAVASRTRSSTLPDVPTMAEAGLPGYETATNYTLFAPAKTPAEIVALLNRETNAILKLPEVQERFSSLGLVATGGSPEQAQARVPAEVEKWAGVIRRGNLQLGS